jgi:hypothetical protein
MHRVFNTGVVFADDIPSGYSLRFPAYPACTTPEGCPKIEGASYSSWGTDVLTASATSNGPTLKSLNVCRGRRGHLMDAALKPA